MLPLPSVLRVQATQLARGMRQGCPPPSACCSRTRGWVRRGVALLAPACAVSAFPAMWLGSALPAECTYRTAALACLALQPGWQTVPTCRRTFAHPAHLLAAVVITLEVVRDLGIPTVVPLQQPHTAGAAEAEAAAAGAAEPAEQQVGQQAAEQQPASADQVQQEEGQREVRRTAGVVPGFALACDPGKHLSCRLLSMYPWHWRADWHLLPALQGTSSLCKGKSLLVASWCSALGPL